MEQSKTIIIRIRNKQRKIKQEWGAKVRKKKYKMHECLMIQNSRSTKVVTADLLAFKYSPVIAKQFSFALFLIMTISEGYES